MASPSRSPKSTSPNCCGNCRFWNQFEAAIGECRRSSPATLTTVEVDQKVIANKGVWPRTFQHEWCGDFATRRSDGRNG